MKTIGLIGGMSWESTIPYYKIINEAVRDRLGGLHSAKILLYSVDFYEIEKCQSSGEWDRCGEMLAGIASRLEAAGADFIVICTNTMHKVVPQMERAIHIPILHIAEATAEELRGNHITKVALLGTKYTMTQDFYKAKLVDAGIEVLVPDSDEIELVNRIIFNELCLGVLTEQSKKDCLRIMNADGELLLRALMVADLITIHQKTPIGRLSAFCGAVSAGCGAAAGIAYLYGGRYDEVAHTIANTLAICSGMICDGAKPSCAAKIASAVNAGLMGYQMYLNGHHEFVGGEGIIKKGVENTIDSVGRLARCGMVDHGIFDDMAQMAIAHGGGSASGSWRGRLSHGVCHQPQSGEPDRVRHRDADGHSFHHLRPRGYAVFYPDHDGASLPDPGAAAPHGAGGGRVSLRQPERGFRPAHGAGRGQKRYADAERIRDAVPSDEKPGAGAVPGAADRKCLGLRVHRRNPHGGRSWRDTSGFFLLVKQEIVRMSI